MPFEWINVFHVNIYPRFLREKEAARGDFMMKHSSKPFRILAEG